MINLSIQSDLIKYIDGSSCSDMIPSLTVKPLDYLTSDVIFEEDKVHDVYFDKYDGVYAEILQATRFDEGTDLSTIYLGKIDMTREQ